MLPMQMPLTAANNNDTHNDPTLEELGLPALFDDGALFDGDMVRSPCTSRNASMSMRAMDTARRSRSCGSSAHEPLDAIRQRGGGERVDGLVH